MNTDAEGKFELRTLPAGQHQIEAWKNGRAGVGAPVTIPAGGAGPDVVIKIRSLASVEGKIDIAALGFVTNPMTQTNLRLRRFGSDSYANLRGSDFKVDGMLPGTYLVVLQFQDVNEDWQPLEIIHPQTLRVGTANAQGVFRKFGASLLGGLEEEAIRRDAGSVKEYLQRYGIRLR